MESRSARQQRENAEKIESTEKMVIMHHIFYVFNLIEVKRINSVCYFRLKTNDAAKKQKNGSVNLQVNPKWL